MSKPLSHKEEYVRMITEQLEAEFPNASGEIIRAAAKCQAEESEFERINRLVVNRPNLKHFRLVKG